MLFNQFIILLNIEEIRSKRFRDAFQKMGQSPCEEFLDFMLFAVKLLVIQGFLKLLVDLK